MVLDVNVLGAAVVDWVLRHLDTRLIVFTDDELRSLLVDSHHGLTMHTMNPLALLNQQAECDVFSFTRGQRNTWLLLAAPTHWRTK